MVAIRLRYMVKLDGYNHLGRKFCFTDFPSKDGCKSAAVTYFHSATQMLQIFDSLRGKAVLEHTCSWKRLFCINMYIYNPPCIAHYKVDILCVYKVGFRSTMGGKAVFCARNMPLDLEDDFIATLAFQFIPGWFPTRKRLNICGIPFYRPLVPFKE